MLSLPSIRSLISTYSHPSVRKNAQARTLLFRVCASVFYILNPQLFLPPHVFSAGLWTNCPSASRVFIFLSPLEAVRSLLACPDRVFPDPDRRFRPVLHHRSTTGALIISTAAIRRRTDAAKSRFLFIPYTPFCRCFRPLSLQPHRGGWRP